MKVSRGSRVCVVKGSITIHTVTPVKKKFTSGVQPIMSVKLKHRTTRMHSSRMPTARSLTIFRGSLPSCGRGWWYPGVGSRRGVVSSGVRGEGWWFAGVVMSRGRGGSKGGRYPLPPDQDLHLPQLDTTPPPAPRHHRPWIPPPP